MFKVITVAGNGEKVAERTARDAQHVQRLRDRITANLPTGSSTTVRVEKI